MQIILNQSGTPYEVKIKAITTTTVYLVHLSYSSVINILIFVLIETQTDGSL